MDQIDCDNDLTPSEALLAAEFEESEQVDLYSYVDRYMIID